MIKLELDWASESTPTERMREVGWEDEHVSVELVDEAGPGGGWPVYAVYVRPIEYAPPHAPYMLLDAWLSDVYGMEDEVERQDIASLAVEV